MPLTMTATATAGTIAIYLVLMVAPGLATGWAAGLRGWVLAGTAPLLTFAVAGLGGPWLAVAGLGFTAASFLAATAVAVTLAASARRLSDRRAARRENRHPFTGARGPDWSRTAHLAVLACVVAAAVVGVCTVLHGLGSLTAVSQGYDAAFHANGIRYIHDTHDGSATGMTTVNRFGDANELFYPHAYHLIGALAYTLAHPITGVAVPGVLNANTVLLPALLALSLATLVRSFHGRATLAGMVAVISVAPATLLYVSMARGPLLPFLLGLSLTPVAVVALHRFVERVRWDTGLVTALVACGLLVIHPGTLLAAMLFAAPMLAQRWFRIARAGGSHVRSGALPARARARSVGTECAAILGAALAGGLLTAPHLVAAVLRTESGFPYEGWPAPFDFSGAVGALLTFQLIPSPHSDGTAQVWLSAALLAGLVFLLRLHNLRWIGGAALLTGLAWLVVATSDHPLVLELTRPWWNDPFRFMAIAAIPMTVLAAHGLAELQAVLRDASARSFAGTRTTRSGTLGAALLCGFAVLTHGLYAHSNAALIGPRYGNPPPENPVNMTVSAAEVEAMRKLGELAEPGEWALNNRHDGTVWTYAFTGVRTVAGHFDDSLQPPRARLLAEHFRDYETDPRVRRAVRELGVRWVIVGTHGHLALPPGDHRQPGLTELDTLPFLERAFRNEAAAIYEITTAADRPAPVPAGTRSGRARPSPPR
ncbi:hypothetical protein H0B56_01490 [Haloechinothrix sp. YIM 98757]|uniref:Glycosyltransferase RgtA/B/C/D-like domain-containing protein n=1 Tax=Haloechinothrix aidingensis TaxID=2752311 RepID=A0A838A7R7_9PSEU|nr:hypothetical protein [Haloechinothrix aidingensis]